MEPRVQGPCFLLEKPEKATCAQSLKGQAERGLGKAFQVFWGGQLNKNRGPPVGLGDLTWWSPEKCRVLESGRSTRQVAPPGQSSPWEASQGHSASGSYCLRSWNLLKVCQECGCLTHSSLRVHSLKFIKPCFPL